LLRILQGEKKEGERREGGGKGGKTRLHFQATSVSLYRPFPLVLREKEGRVSLLVRRDAIFVEPDRFGPFQRREEEGGGGLAYV